MKEIKLTLTLKVHWANEGSPELWEQRVLDALKISDNITSNVESIQVEI